jgi:tRNA(Arg) A34 adenosine deaminase TadA
MKISIKAQRNIFLISSVILFIVLFSYIISPICSKIRPSVKINENNKKTLIKLASLAMANGDLPVSAILLYNNKIIGEGFNTVKKDSNSTGHAEINAIQYAFRKIGNQDFKNLNKDSLVLISTFEPCLMCKGVICNYEIKNVYFMKSKGLNNWINNGKKLFRYEWNCKRTGQDFIHDSLFKVAKK